MFRNKGENLHSIYVLLFLNIAFFVIAFQDQARYAAFFCLDRDAFLSGQVWRIFTYQFVQGGKGFFYLSPIIALFFTVLILYLMGSAVEEAWGTRNFVLFYALSTLGSAAVGLLLATPLLGSFFLSYSLLFVYASLFPDQTLYVFYILPVRVKWLALIVLGILVAAVVGGSRANLAAFAGALLSYSFFLLQRAPRKMFKRPSRFSAPPEARPSNVHNATKNVTRYAAMKNALSTRSDSDIDRLIGLSESEITPGVNICPPADYKPEANDGYCVRCEGFAECSARYLRLNRPQVAAPSATPVETTTLKATP